MAVTTDSWASKAVNSFTTYTAHFIDDNWSLQSYVPYDAKFWREKNLVNQANYK